MYTRNCLASARALDFVTSCTWSPYLGNSADTCTAVRRARVDRDPDRDREVATAGGGPDHGIEDPDLKIDAREETKRAGMVDLGVIKIKFYSYS